MDLVETKSETLKAIEDLRAKHSSDEVMMQKLTVIEDQVNEATDMTTLLALAENILEVVNAKLMRKKMDVLSCIRTVRVNTALPKKVYERLNELSASVEEADSMEQLTALAKEVLGLLKTYV